MRPLPVSRQLIGLGAWLFLTFCAAALGAMASVKAGVFYQELARPEWAPPGWIFGPVWSGLYIMMGIAAWLVWREVRLVDAKPAFSLFLVQLAANALWSWLFFAWHKGAAAFGEVIFLWVLVAATLVAFWRVRRLAGILLLPYLAWVTFAAVLCYAVWRLNPGALGH